MNLNPERLLMGWIFPTYNVHKIAPLLLDLLMTHPIPLVPHTYWQTSLAALPDTCGLPLPNPIQLSADKGGSLTLFSPYGREAVKIRVLFIYIWSIPSPGYTTVKEQG